MTPAQEALFKYALGDGKDWPRVTIDPEVNYEVDRLVSFPDMPPWSQAPEKIRFEYWSEVEFFKKLALQRQTVALIIFRAK